MGEENRLGDDEEKRRHRRELDAKNARLRRAKRRADKERTWREAHATGATGPSVVTETTPPSVMLKDHIVRTVRGLEAVERDETISNAERARIYVQAVPALCRAVDADEFRSRLEAVERALSQHARPQLRSVGS